MAQHPSVHACQRAPPCASLPRKTHPPTAAPAPESGRSRGRNHSSYSKGREGGESGREGGEEGRRRETRDSHMKHTDWDSHAIECHGRQMQNASAKRHLVHFFPRSARQSASTTEAHVPSTRLHASTHMPCSQSRGCSCLPLWPLNFESMWGRRGLRPPAGPPAAPCMARQQARRRGGSGKGGTTQANGHMCC